MEYLTRLKNFWFPDWNALAWLFLALPALYFFQTTIHEGTHMMAALVVTGNAPKLAPFPHRTLSGDFLNGVTLDDPSTDVTVIERTSCTSPTRSRNTRLAGFAAMPQFIALGLAVLFSVLFFFTTFTQPMVRLGLRLWFLGACIDFMYGTARALGAGCNEKADWGKFMLGADINPGLFAFMTWIFWLIILSHFVWVNWSGWGRETVPPTNFWDYRWIAFMLGILSLVAVLWSVFLNDPAILKDSAEFIVPLIFQIVALIWYWIYFGLTFKYRSSAA